MQNGIQRNYFYFMIKRDFQKRKFAHSLHQMNSSSLLRTMLAFLIKETWKTPRLAAILDFNELERLGMNKVNYGQQPCHCRLGESRVVYHLHEKTVWFTVWAIGKQIPYCDIPFGTGVYHLHKSFPFTERVWNWYQR